MPRGQAGLAISPLRGKVSFFFCALHAQKGYIILAAISLWN